MLPGLAQEVHQRQAGQPVGVVDHPRGVGTLEAQVPAQLLRQRLGIGGDLLGWAHGTLGALAAGVAHETGSPSHEGNRGAAAPLEPGEAHDRNQVSHMKRGRSGIKAHIGLDGTRIQALGGTGRGVLHQAPAGELLEESWHQGQE